MKGDKRIIGHVQMDPSFYDMLVKGLTANFKSIIYDVVPFYVNNTSGESPPAKIHQGNRLYKITIEEVE